MLAHGCGDIACGVGIDANIRASVFGFAQAEIVQIDCNDRECAGQPRKGRGQLAHNAHAGDGNSFAQFGTTDPMAVQGNGSHDHECCGFGRDAGGCLAEIIGQDRVAGVVALASNAVAGLYPLHIFADFEHHACVAVAGGARKCFRTRWFAAVCVAVDFRANAYGGVVVLHQNAVVGHERQFKVRQFDSPDVCAN